MFFAIIRAQDVNSRWEGENADQEAVDLHGQRDCSGPANGGLPGPGVPHRSGRRVSPWVLPLEVLAVPAQEPDAAQPPW